MLCFCGCNKDRHSKTAAEEDSSKLVQMDFDTSGLDVEKLDINQDGKVDQFIYSKDGVTQYARRDFNFDEIIDMTEIYKDGVHYRDEIDLDYDGICDLIVTYNEDGIPVKKEFSIDFQGNRHGTQLFDAQGNRTEIRRDTNGDGILDTAEYYLPGEDEPFKTTPISKTDNP